MVYFVNIPVSFTVKLPSFRLSSMGAHLCKQIFGNFFFRGTNSGNELLEFLLVCRSGSIVGINTIESASES